MRERTPRYNREDKPDYSVLTKGGDPYVYPGTSVLRNKFGIKDASALTTLETVATRRRLGELAQSTVKTPNNLEGLRAIHKHIFQDVYHFAGRPRRVELFKPETALGGASVAYSAPTDIRKDVRAAFKQLNSRNWEKMSVEQKATAFSQDLAKIWQAHPFREGNTRAVMVFAEKFTREKDMQLDMSLLKENAAYVRTSLVAATEGQPEHLTKIMQDAMERGSSLERGELPTLRLGLDRDRDR